MTKRRLLKLEPREEAALVAYIVFYDLCKKQTCWKTIGQTIRKYGQRTRKIVYRGHSKKDATIKRITPFFSTSPNKKMAELFVEKKWTTEQGVYVGNLFKLHLQGALTLNTCKIKYTLSKEVLGLLFHLIGGKKAKIQKEGKTYSFKQYLPHIKKTLKKLVFDRSETNDDEILVLNGGTFYKNKEKTRKGLSSHLSKKGYKVREAWYTTD
jgi:hypothetical protein